MVIHIRANNLPLDLVNWHPIVLIPLIFYHSDHDLRMI